MKHFFRHAGDILLLCLLCLLLVSGCQSNSGPPVSALAKQDTLVSMIEREIAKKKARHRQLAEFRKRHLSSQIYMKIKEYYPIIRKYSKRYGIDWRLIIAQILKESRFKEDARSHVGAMGLMQIMPRTAREITRELDIQYIARDPRENITAGIYHMYKQLNHFQNADHENRIKLALAAYNCGPARIVDAQDIARYKNLDPHTWPAIKQCLPLLTAEDWKLHLEVWEQGLPTYGYFYGYEQTIDYVDDIYQNYNLLRHVF